QVVQLTSVQRSDQHLNGRRRGTYWLVTRPGFIHSLFDLSDRGIDRSSALVHDESERTDDERGTRQEAGHHAPARHGGASTCSNVFGLKTGRKGFVTRGIGQPAFGHSEVEAAEQKTGLAVFGIPLESNVRQSGYARAPNRGQCRWP